MPSFNLLIVSPAGKAFEGEAASVVAPGRDGMLGVLAHHAPMIAALRPGLATVTAGGETHLFYTGEGVIEVSRTDVVLLVDEAAKVAKADEARAILKQRLETTAAAAAGSRTPP